MTSLHDIPPLDGAGLRKFGLVMAIMIATLFGLLFPWLLDAALPLWPWVVAGFLAGWSLLHPNSLEFLYHGWMRLGLALGWVSSRLILGILFFLVFTPVSAVFRLRGVDPLHRRPDPQASSYRRQSKVRDVNHMEKPF